MKRKDKITEELNLIQIQIQRMANNSFIIKGWYITFMLAFLTYLLNQKKIELIFLGCVPLIFCLVYDCYFLRLERLYIEKYNWVISNIDSDKYLFDLNPEKKEMQKENILWKDIILSKSILLLYFLPIIIFICIA